MPKNKKPAGGSRAQSFEPRYGAKKTSYQDAKRRPGQSSAGTPGSKSPNHRGYRPEASTDAGAPAKKQRWNAQERAGRDEARGIRSHSAGREDRPRRDDRPARSYDDRPARSYDDRPARSYDDRPRRDARPARDDARAQNSSDSGRERPNRRDFGQNGSDRRSSDRPARSYDDRPRGERQPRDDRRTFGDARPSFRDDRPRRAVDDRPRRDDHRYGDRRVQNSFDPGSERPNRRDSGQNGADRRSYDRPARDDRPRRDDRPTRSYDDRPRRDARPARSYDDRPRRDDRPAYAGNRSDWHADAKDAAKRKAYEEHADTVHEKLQAEAIQAEEVAGVTFGALGLGDNIVRALEGLGAASPFPIQAATIAPILEGKDVLARGRTGSGKTIAFGAPLVESILRSQAGKRREFGRSPKALILAPTRELALQIDRTIQPIARSVGLFTTQVYGGVPQARQVGALKKGVDIVIGTPGRIEDLQEQGKLDLSEIRIVVLDEADHMSELGFLEPMQRLLRLVPAEAQKLLFSATLDREVAALVDEFLVEPAVYEVAGEDQDSGTIDHRVLVIDHRDKAEILTSLVDRSGKTLVFARTRAYAEMLAEQFDDAGIKAVALHGDLNQAKRTRNLERLTSGRVDVLVATDVAARGIHVDDIDLVIQADAPDEYKTYLHRSGRTGRAGRSGTVVTLITRQRRRRMTEMLDRAEIDAPFEDARPGDDLIEELAGRQVVPA
ncbi:MAG: DEAD/DEAH box helicase [Microbacterium sp.]|uniref:DEAD/DEAH box helicase n=1 Tax=Microbacterium sp. TaxID=51671 RepID=UPI001ACFCAB1|nr:DEAD/DEAH box helicase [Microbacterium sp.]MBN9176714.1 DEAD/DEAH box helicase [Microbacterium sp.]